MTAHGDRRPGIEPVRYAEPPPPPPVQRVPSRVRVVLHVDSPKLHGNLVVSGFATTATAMEIGDVLADALRRYTQGHVKRCVELEEFHG